MSIKRPEPFLWRWAEQALSNEANGISKTIEIPGYEAVDASKGRANIPTGFPVTTMKSVLNGGVPPWGQDHNGILYKITESIQWTQAGGIPVFDKKLEDQLKGYSIGAELRSTRFAYVSYINMVSDNKTNPDEASDINAYWRNDANVGNGWAIKTILSDDANSISYLDGNRRIVTKVAGSRPHVYVRPSYAGGELLPAEGGEKPCLSIGAAIESIPDGGTATIHLYCKDDFCLTYDNKNTPQEYLTNGLGIGSRHLYFEPYGEEDWYSAFRQVATAHDSAVNIYELVGFTRPIIYIPTNINSFGNQTLGFIGGEYGSTIRFSGFIFEIMPGKGLGSQNASPFNPNTKFQFSGCIFNKIENLHYMYGGWGGATNTLDLSRCQINGSGTFVLLGGSLTTLVVGGSRNVETGLPGYQYIESNCDIYFSKKTNYFNFNMVPVSYGDTLGNKPNYAPLGLKTNLTLDFS